VRDERCAHAVSVPDNPLDEVVLFEARGFDDATQLCRRLAEDWFAWVQSEDGYRSVAVLLDPEAGDLARLMRAVQQWQLEQGGGSLRFELDGRRYALEIGMKAAA
jgi:hypothetical protein